MSKPKNSKTRTRSKEHPSTKKDGTPWKPWSEEVEERLAKKALARAANPDVPEDRTGKCTAMTTGVHGPKRPCDRWALEGQKVCYVHGGNTKAAKDVAKRRFLEELDPSISRLTELRDQSEHMPTAFAASKEIVNRVLGKVGEADRQNTNITPIINIGVNLGGLAKRASKQKALEESPAIEADFTVEDEE